MLLDEATAALDPSNEKLVQQTLANLVTDKTLIVVAHRLSTIRAADQILAIDAGRIVQRGTHEELLKRGGLYARFWNERQQAAGWRLASMTSHNDGPWPDSPHERHVSPQLAKATYNASCDTWPV